MKVYFFKLKKCLFIAIEAKHTKPVFKLKKSMYLLYKVFYIDRHKTWGELRSLRNLAASSSLLLSCRYSGKKPSGKNCSQIKFELATLYQCVQTREAERISCTFQFLENNYSKIQFTENTGISILKCHLKGVQAELL